MRMNAPSPLVAANGHDFLGGTCPRWTMIVYAKYVAAGWVAFVNLTQMIAELRAERDGVEQAIHVLERIVAGRGKRRGRPPLWMSQIKRRGRPPGSKNKSTLEKG